MSIAYKLIYVYEPDSPLDIVWPLQHRIPVLFLGCKNILVTLSDKHTGTGYGLQNAEVLLRD